MTSSLHVVNQAQADALQKYAAVDWSKAQALLGRAGSVVGRGTEWLFRRHPLPKEGYGPGLWNTLKGLGHGLAEGARELSIGSPASLEETLKKPGGLKQTLRSFVWPERGPVNPEHGPLRKGLGTAWHYGGNTLQAALNLGLPAYQLYSAAKDPLHRGEYLGSGLAGLAATPFTMHMGLFGMPLVQAPISQLGGWLGKKFDPKPEVEMPHPGWRPTGARSPVLLADHEKTSDWKSTLRPAWSWLKEHPLTALEAGTLATVGLGHLKKPPLIQHPAFRPRRPTALDPTLDQPLVLPPDWSGIDPTLMPSRRDALHGAAILTGNAPAYRTLDFTAQQMPQSTDVAPGP